MAQSLGAKADTGDAGNKAGFDPGQWSGQPGPGSACPAQRIAADVLLAAYRSTGLPARLKP